MSVQRAISCCPRCNYETEIWFHKSKVVPKDEMLCVDCNQSYTGSNFVIGLLELRSNVSPSSIQLAKDITAYLL